MRVDRRDRVLVQIATVHSWLVVGLTVALAVFVISLAATIGMNLVALFDASPAQASEAFIPASTPTSGASATSDLRRTYNPTSTPTVSASPTPLSTSRPTVPMPVATTGTPVPTQTPLPTGTPTPVETSAPEEALAPEEAHTPVPTETMTPEPTPAATMPAQGTTGDGLEIPSAVKIDPETHWIDVDLSDQRLTAYVGKTPVKSYLVSTGLPQTPTPVGQYAIWIKLRYDDMAGSDYYIEDVPYVMYFYEGYGLHGVTWHANFGHPMSHGCVNQPNDMAEWLFHFAEVGTMVNIHD